MTTEKRKSTISEGVRRISSLGAGARRSTMEIIKIKSAQLKTIATKQWPQYLAGFIANLCLLSVGIHFGWSSAAIPQLTGPNSPIPTTMSEASWITSIQPLGDFVGAPLAAFFCERIGRKKTILVTTIPHLTSWFLIVFATTPHMLMVARFISGIAEGAVFTCIPMYLGEIAEPKIRGVLGAGITLSLISGIMISNIIGSLASIQTAALISATFPIVTIISYAWMPNSPYYCAMKKKKEEAMLALRKLRGIDEVDDELKAIMAGVEQQMSNPTSFKILFTEKSNRRAMLIMLGLRLFQQLAGISAITYYTQTIFEQSGMELSTFTATMLYLTTQIITTIVCTVVVDKFGRIPLLIVSIIGASIAHLALGGYFYIQETGIYDINSLNLVPVFAMIGYIVIFSIGYGTLPNLMIGELFAANVKAKALCLLHFVFAFCLFASAKSFMFLTENFGSYVPFWLYSVSCIIAVFFTWFCVPETKGKTLAEIQEWLQH